MRPVILLAVLLTVFPGCKKEKGVNYTVQGVITDLSFNTPAAGVQVSLYQTPAGGESKLAQTVTTGSDGSYSFTIKRDKIEAFKLICTKNNYFSDSRSFTLEDLNAKENNTFNFGLNAKSWVRLIFKNTNPGESISVSRTQGLTGCDECCTYSSFLLNGVTDTSFVCLNTGNTPYAYKWIYLTGSGYSDNSVTSVPLDTTDLLLNF